MNMNPKDIIGPTAVLVGVCLVFTAAVVGTNSLTAEKIAILNQQTADEAYFPQLVQLHIHTDCIILKMRIIHF